MTGGIYANLRCFRLYGDCSMAAILVFQNNEKEAMLVFQTLVEVELFPCVNAFFCSTECAFMLATRVKTPCWLFGGTYCHENN